MKRQCPWCLEPLPKAVVAAECPHCGRLLGSAGEPAARELRFTRVEAAQNAAFRRMLIWGSAAAAVIALVTPLLHALAVVAVPLTLASHLVAVRVLLVRDAQKLMGPLRRWLNRWLMRFAFLWIGLPGYGAMTAPLVGVVFGTGTFCLLTTLAHLSTSIGLQRERSASPLAWWEKAVPAALAAVTVLALLILVAVAAFLGWSVMAIIESLRAT